MTRRAHLPTLLLASTALCHGFGPAGAGELPTGPSVAHGAVSVTTPGSGVMSIQQGSPTAIVNWQSFSVGQGNRVDIRQPSTDSTLLNRVTGSTTSTIAGQVNANGQVFLINPNGILITPTGSVKAGGGFVASTLDTTDADFVAGKRTFRGNGSSKNVTNNGAIEIGQGGYAALIGGTVDNAGTVSVPLGRVGFGAGELVTIDPSGDGFLQVALPSSGIAADRDLIVHSGRITAGGGRVEMKAATARNVARGAVNVSGVVEATTVSGRSGAIVLGGGEGGAVKVSGKLVANAPARSKARGGSITVTGQAVALKGATLDASGDAGGGTIRVGGDFQGTGTLQRAVTTSVDKGSLVFADAGETGDGGSVVIWSDQHTAFAGSIFARGGSVMGNGGSVEVSSKGLLDYTGRTDLRAPFGAFGTLLLDPFDLFVENSSSSGVTTTGSSGSITFTATPSPGTTSVLDVNTLQQQLELGNVTLSTGTGGTGAGSITIGYPVTWTLGSTLTLSAIGGDVNIGYGFNAPAGSVIITANTVFHGNVVPLSDGSVAAIAGAPAFGSVTLQNLSIFASSIQLNGNYTIGDTLLLQGSGVALGTPAFQTSVSAGTLSLSASTISAASNISVGLFDLQFGTWTQNGGGGGLPAFSASDFQVNTSSGAAFLRVLGGDGSVASPYLVGDIYGLQGIGTGGSLSQSFALANDIDASGTFLWNQSRFGGSGSGFIPIGSVGQPFAGTFNGNGHTIDRLVVAWPSDQAGLFGANAGLIEGVKVTGSFVAGFTDVGGLVGLNEATGIVRNSLFSGTVQSVSSSDSLANLGGLVGRNLGLIQTSAATADAPTPYSGIPVAGFPLSLPTSAGVGAAFGTPNVGGLVGFNGGQIVDAYARIPVYADPLNSGLPSFNVGGLVGFAGLGSRIVNTYAAAPVVGTGPSIGGLVGAGLGDPVTASFWDTTVSGQAVSAGGTGLTTAELQDPAGFVALAGPLGWDFQTVWAPGGPGRYPQLYAVDTVQPFSVLGPALLTQVADLSAPAVFDANTLLTSPYSSLPILLEVPDEVLGTPLGGGGSGGTGGAGGSGGGPTQGTGQNTTTLETAKVSLAYVEQRLAQLDSSLSECNQAAGKGLAVFSGCVGDAMSRFAAALDERVIELPPSMKGVSAVIRQAAERVRKARSIREARAAVQDALSAVRKAITLIRADDPAVARVQRRQGTVIRTALERCDFRLAQAGDL